MAGILLPPLIATVTNCILSDRDSNTVNYAEGHGCVMVHQVLVNLGDSPFKGDVAILKAGGLHAR